MDVLCYYKITDTIIGAQCSIQTNQILLKTSEKVEVMLKLHLRIAFKVNFTRREYQNCGENIKWSYSENDPHAARKSELSSNDAFLYYV